MVQSVEIFDLNVGFAPVQHFIMQKVSICEITKKNTEDKTRKIQHLDFSPKVCIVAKSQSAEITNKNRLISDLDLG